MFKLTEDELETATNALRIASDECFKAAKECGKAGDQSVPERAFRQSAIQYLNLAEKIESRD
jgi:hypothetical protein